MKNILVTGGCGFIGSHTCLTLLESGYKLITVFQWFMDRSGRPSLRHVLYCFL